jgi:hypothetical protein
MVGQGYPDLYIQQQLNGRFSSSWNLDTIRRARRKMGFIKNSKGEFPSLKNEPAAYVASQPEPSLMGLPPSDLDDAGKAEWFRKQFRRGHLFGELQRQFGADEVIAYLEEYGRVCCQFADIVTSEYFQIDDFLKHRLLVNRVLREQNVLRDELDETRQWLASNPPDEDDLPDVKRRRLEQTRTLESKRGAMAKIQEIYDKLVAARDKIYTALSATRRDRIDQLKSGGQNFFHLVASILQDSDVRAEQGRYAELTRMAATDVVNEWRKPMVFPNGDTEPVLLDADILVDGEDMQAVMPGEEDEE